MELHHLTEYLSAKLRVYFLTSPGVSLAIFTASSSLLKRYSGATGPKVSSLVMTMPVVTSVNTVGSKKLPPSAGVCRR